MATVAGVEAGPLLDGDRLIGGRVLQSLELMRAELSRGLLRHGWAEPC
jgi:hypothetical protein